ncbi:50S ribosomal subunit protein L15 [Pseudodesulfovibrio profundus]|uniref:Large ribosomal subunit protein uL15 n=1 Tax=Pseudodesulfovibrio profundus TaxID=57320 RepID=A0A2C8FGE0_9BACT|nr:50S ribosomal protein L15 [Pseudodesulfovibrio profundus]MBC16366.1 50S ribosomal protein L15 [Desulfovibrio sp.]SOB60901.1 50S ribosomal subunit protein L15 [Pseudodesulfovibrio profundus]|tara:strand:+ start:38041 stop:38487 length:447 start_codon:yes stop_codon:yes gene_type:complete
MRLHELYAFPEEYKNRRRIGRGSGSGWGKTSAKGHKGQNSRSGGGVRPGFEGGQMPLARRLPKRGFKNPFRVEYEAVNVGQLISMFEGKDEITLADIYDRGVAKEGAPVKVLGTGEVEKAVTIEAHRFSASAAEKIAKAGGNAKAIEG